MAASVYVSGDTGYSDHFARIGSPFEPFDMAFVKIGAYGPARRGSVSSCRPSTRGGLAPPAANQIEQVTPHISEVADADRPFTSTPQYLTGRTAAR